MGMKAKSTGGEPRELVPPGNYLAVVCGVYDIGTQTGGQYGAKHQIIVTWELHKRKGPVRNGKGDVQVISKFYNFSFNEKATLRQDVEAMLGVPVSEEAAKDGFDIETLIGKACRLTVAHTKKKNGDLTDIIQSLAPLDPEDDTPPSPELDDHYYEITDAKVIPDDLPAWVAKKIRESQEFGGKKEPVAAGATANGSADDDDCPF